MMAYMKINPVYQDKTSEFFFEAHFEEKIDVIEIDEVIPKVTIFDMGNSMRININEGGNVRVLIKYVQVPTHQKIHLP